MDDRLIFKNNRNIRRNYKFHVKRYYNFFRVFPDMLCLLHIVIFLLHLTTTALSENGFLEHLYNLYHRCIKIFEYIVFRKKHFIINTMTPVQCVSFSMFVYDIRIACLFELFQVSILFTWSYN